MNNNKKPLLIVIAGPNGSGKTSITNKILQHEWLEECIYINPDIIANEKFGNWNNEKAVLDAAKFATQLREECLIKKNSLIFETVFSSNEKVTFILKAKEAGYFIRLFFIGTNNPKINASRIAQRVMEGGHDVPIRKIISRHSKSINNCCSIANQIDRAYIYDNSIDYNEPQLLFRFKHGKIEKVYHSLNDWSLPIFETALD
jgi:predicted ABC-type ATPase